MFFCIILKKVELEQSNFLERKTHFFIGYNEVIETLLAYAKGINPDNLRIEGIVYMALFLVM